jgi:hypothetical protein
MSVASGLAYVCAADGLWRLFVASGNFDARAGTAVLAYKDRGLV